MNRTSDEHLPGAIKFCVAKSQEKKSSYDQFRPNRIITVQDELKRKQSPVFSQLPIKVRTPSPAASINRSTTSEDNFSIGPGYSPAQRQPSVVRRRVSIGANYSPVETTRSPKISPAPSLNGMNTRYPAVSSNQNHNSQGRLSGRVSPAPTKSQALRPSYSAAWDEKPNRPPSQTLPRPNHEFSNPLDVSDISEPASTIYSNDIETKELYRERNGCNEKNLKQSEVLQPTIVSPITSPQNIFENEKKPQNFAQVSPLPESNKLSDVASFRPTNADSSFCSSFFEADYMSDDSDSSREDGHEMQYRWDYLEGGSKDEELLVGDSPDPQSKSMHSNAWLIRLLIILHLIWLIIFFWWRISFSFKGLSSYSLVYPILFLLAELFLSFSFLASHLSRAFPVARTQTTLDHLIARDHNIQVFKVAILIPTYREQLDTIRQAVFGAFDLNLWKSNSSKCKVRSQLRIIVLDLGKRVQVMVMMNQLYKFIQQVQTHQVQEFLIYAGCKLNLEDIYQLLISQRSHDLLDASDLKRRELVIEIIAIATHISECCASDSIKKRPCGLQKSSFFSCLSRHKRSVETQSQGPENLETDSSNKSPINSKQDIENHKSQPTRENSTTELISEKDEDSHCTTLQARTIRFCETEMLPYLIYSVGDENHLPADISDNQYAFSKAMAVNAALFPNLTKINEEKTEVKPLVGNSDFIVLNDAGYKLHPDFLQKTMPYFFALDKPTYRWGSVGFVQTSPRFPGIPDPLYTFDSILHELRYPGQDGKDAVLAEHHSSIFRLESLKGARPDGSKYAKIGNIPKKTATMIGSSVGFKTTTFAPFLHTSVELAKEGWLSVHAGVLSTMLEVPCTVQKRLEDLYRQHVGLMQLVFHRGFVWLLEGPRVPTAFHRVYSFELGLEIVRALALEILMFLPIALALGLIPFSIGSNSITYMIMYIIVVFIALGPSILSMSQKKHLLPSCIRYWQLTCSTSYLHFLAFFKVFWVVKLRRKPPSAVKLRCSPNLLWPVFVRCGLVFLAVLFATWKWAENILNKQYKVFFHWFAVLLGASCVLYVHWPLLCFSSKKKAKQQLYIGVLVLLMFLIILVSIIYSFF